MPLGSLPAPRSRALLPPWLRQVRRGEVAVVIGLLGPRQVRRGEVAVVTGGPVRKLAEHGDMMAEWLISLLPTAGPRPV